VLLDPRMSLRETHSPIHANQPRPDHAYTEPLHTVMMNNATGPANPFDAGEQVLLIESFITHTHSSSVPPLPPLLLSVPAVLVLPDPGLLQPKTQLSEDMPDFPLQSGRTRATKATGPRYKQQTQRCIVPVV